MLEDEEVELLDCDSEVVLEDVLSGCWLLVVCIAGSEVFSLLPSFLPAVTVASAAMGVIILPTSKKPPPGPPTTTVPGTTIMVAPPDIVDVVTVTPLDVVDEDDVTCGVGDILSFDNGEELDDDGDVLDRDDDTNAVGDVPDRDNEANDTVGEDD